MIPIPLHGGAGAVGTGGSAGGPKPSGIQPRRPLEQVTCFKVHYSLVHITYLIVALQVYVLSPAPSHLAQNDTGSEATYIMQ